MAERGIRWREGVSALIWAVATWVAAMFSAVPSAAVVAALLGGLGYLVGCLLAQSSLRVAAGIVGLGFVYLGFGLASDVVANTYWIASLLGAAPAFIFSQWLGFGGQAFCLTAFLRFLSGRQPALISAEILTVTLMLASPLAAHREGYISRPHFLVDPLWSRNLDPVPVLFALGAGAAVLLVLLQNGRRTRRASAFDVVLLLLLIGGLYAVIPDRQLLDFDIRDPLGVRGKDAKNGKGGNSNKESQEVQEAQKAREGKPNEGQGGGSSEAEEMPLDKPQENKSKQKPVAIVLLRDDYDPPYGYFYFRQTAFSQYNGKRLVAETTGKVDQDLLPRYPTEKMTIRSTVPETSPYHRKLGTFVAMITGHAKPFTLVDGVQVEPAPNPNASQFVRAYECQSLVLNTSFERLFPLKAGDESWSEDAWKLYTQGPSDPRYKELAEKCVAKLPPEYQQSDFARAVAIKLWMDRTMTYTMKASHEGYPDPVAHYLFEVNRGYCVHQAHAAVYLWRSLGLPARVGAGYATDARNRGSGSAVLLRSGEAHAWPEIYLRGAGWVILDISPEKAEGGEMDEPDPNLQRLLGELARQNEKRPDQSKKKSLQEMFREFLRALGFALKWLFAGGLVGLYLYKYYRRFEPLWCSAKRLPVAALRSGLDQLAEVGQTRGYGEGRLDFARRLQLESLEPLTHHHLAVTLGGREAPQKELLQLREKLHQQIARRFPLGRRLLGFLNPISWWNSR